MKTTTKHAVGKRKRGAGFSMIELMIAIALGLIVLVAISYAYLSNRLSYMANKEIARMGQSARVTLDGMATSLRMAGSVGCYRNEQSLMALDSGNAELSEFVEAINETNNAARVSVDGEGRLRFYSAGTKSMAQIDVREVTEKTLTVGGGVTAYKLDLHATGSNPEGGIASPFMVISDCEKAVVFKAESVNIPASGDGTIVAAGGANFADKAIFGRGAQVFGMVSSSETFELRETDPQRLDLNNKPLRSLFHNDTELAEGVEAFQVCGIYNDGSGDGTSRILGGSKLNYESYALEPITPQPPPSNPNAELDGIEVNLVLASVPPRLLEEDTKMSISLCGDETELDLPTDRRLRRLFVSSIDLRARKGEKLQEQDNSE